MPRCWSPAKLALRKQIAIERGYVIAKPIGFSHVLVPLAIAQRVKGMAKGLDATRSLELLTGQHRRTGSSLAAAALPSSGTDAAEQFIRTDRAANSCKHAAFLPGGSRRLGLSDWPPLARAGSVHTHDDHELISDTLERNDNNHELLLLPTAGDHELLEMKCLKNENLWLNDENRRLNEELYEWNQAWWLSFDLDLEHGAVSENADLEIQTNLDDSLPGSSAALDDTLCDLQLEPSDVSPSRLPLGGSLVRGPPLGEAAVLLNDLVAFDSLKVLQNSFDALKTAFDEVKLGCVQMMKTAVTEVVNETVVFAASQSSSKLVAYVDFVGGALLERLGALATAVGSVDARISSLEFNVVVPLESSVARGLSGHAKAFVPAPPSDGYPPVVFLPPVAASRPLDDGDAVRVFGLSSAAGLALNDRFGLIVGVDSPAGRYLVRFAPGEQPRKIKFGNVQFPVMCPRCGHAAPRGACYACGFGTSGDVSGYVDDLIKEESNKPEMRKAGEELNDCDRQEGVCERTLEADADDDWEEEDLEEMFRDRDLEAEYDDEHDDLKEAFRDRDLEGAGEQYWA